MGVSHRTAVPPRVPLYHRCGPHDGQETFLVFDLGYHDAREQRGRHAHIAQLVFLVPPVAAADIADVE